MRSSNAARPTGMPAVLPYLRPSPSLSTSTAPQPPGDGAAGLLSIASPDTSPAPAPLPVPARSTRASASVVPGAAAAGAVSPRPPLTATAASSDDPLLVSLAQSDLSTAKSAAEAYYAQYKEAMAENAQLRAALQQHEVDSVQVVHFLEGKLKEMQVEATAYQAGVTQLLADHRSAEESLQLQYGEMVRERDAELARYAAVTTRLHDDLQQASRYVQQRQEHATELRQLQAQLEELAASHEKEIAALHFQTVDRKLKLIALEKTMRAEFDALVEAQATRALEARFQGVLERTKDLEAEKAALTHNLQDLMQLTSQIDAERLQVRRAAAVQQQAHRELKSHALARGRQKEQADFKAYQLEERLREATAQHARQAAEAEARHAARAAALEEELRATRNALQTHRAELQQMRQLTAKVVSERSELENFFHTALADCQRYRHTMAATATSAKAGLGGSSGVAARTSGRTVGSLGEKVEWGGSSSSGGGGGNGAAVASSTLDGSVGAAALPSNGVFFEELSWKDKEKVIKSLLFFLNANYYKSSPPPESAVARS